MLGITTTAVTATSASASADHHVTVVARAGWTDTGIDVQRGNTATISASGTLQFRQGTPRVGPQGVARGAECDRLEQRGAGAWPAPKLACWSLIGRVGTGEPFAIGRTATVHFSATGRLSLGINDNYLRDNAGSWSVQLVLGAAPAATPSSPRGKSSSTVVILVVIVVALAGLLLAFALLRRRARRGGEGAETETPRSPVTSDAIAAGTTAVAAERLVPTDDDHTVVPDESDAAHVNIFEVDLTTDALRVGYNQFPEGVAVEWTVRDEMTPRAHGSFVTNGGGETEHYVSLPVDAPPTGHGNTMAVEFRWTIGDVPFTYSVKRVPGAKRSPTLDTPVE